MYFTTSQVETLVEIVDRFMLCRQAPSRVFRLKKLLSTSSVPKDLMSSIAKAGGV